MKSIVFQLFKAVLIAGALLVLRGEQPVVARMSSSDNIPLVGYANPAAIYCGSLGYKYEVQHEKSGDVGVCNLPDKSTCNGWDFLGGKCGEKFSVCAKQGYGIQTRIDQNNPYSSSDAVCLDKAGKEVGTVTELAKLEDKSTKTSCIKRPPVTVEQGAPMVPTLDTSLPASFDWRARPKGNYVTGVRDQGQCGSCWAFSAVGVTEAALNIANDTVGDNFNLSEQYLVSDCSGAGNCCGGSPAGALSYIHTSGIPDEGCMQYVDGNYDGTTTGGCQCSGGVCGAGCAHNSGGKCSDKTCGDRCSDYATRLVKLSTIGTVFPTRDTIKDMLITKGPLSVTLSMSGYFDAKTRIYQCRAGAPVNHAVVLVGYNDAGGYWIAKNSWGSTWNGDGYFKVGYGQCSVENDIYYVTMAGWAPTPQAPSGTITVTTPTYTWDAFAGATQYQYEVLQGTTPIYSYIVDTSACNDTSCSHTPPDVLPYGSYSWHVQAHVKGAWKGYSGGEAFSVASPPIPVLVSPNGSTTDRTPTFKFAKVVRATKYQYQLWKGSTLVYVQAVAAGACGAVNCASTPGTVLGFGSYTWRARAYVGGAWKGYSEKVAFTISNPNIPKPQMPYDVTSVATPTFTWTKVPGATAYRYQVLSGTTIVYAKSVPSSVCGTTTCSHTPTIVLPAGPYTWRVRVLKNGTWQPFSGTMPFVLP